MKNLSNFVIKCGKKGIFSRFLTCKKAFNPIVILHCAERRHLWSSTVHFSKSLFQFKNFHTPFLFWCTILITLPTAEILSGKKCVGISGFWVLNEIIQKNILKIWKKSWEPFGSYQLNSTANSAHFHPNWAGLAVLFSRQLLNGSQDFFFVLIF